MVAVKAVAAPPAQVPPAVLGFIAASEFVLHYPGWEAEREQRVTGLLRSTADELVRRNYSGSQKAAVVIEFHRQCARITQHVRDNQMHYHLAMAACDLYAFHPTTQLLQSIQALVLQLQRPYELN